MCGSKGVCDVFAVWLAGVEFGAKVVHAASGEGYDSVVGAFSPGALSVAEGAAFGVGERDESGLEDDALEIALAAGGSLDRVGLVAPAQNGRESVRGGEDVGAVEAGVASCVGDKLRPRHDPCHGKALDEARQCGEVDALLERMKQQRQQVAQARQATRLVHDVLPAAAQAKADVLGCTRSGENLCARRPVATIHRGPACAVLAPHSDDPQNLISDRSGRRGRADRPPESSRATSITPIYDPLPTRSIHQFGRPAKPGVETFHQGSAT